MKEEYALMSKGFTYAKEKICSIKETHKIKTFRFHELTKAPTFHPETPVIPTI
jgi:hypothetical protein